MDGFLPVFYLLVVLKIPVLAAIWLIWWAGKPPLVETVGDERGGGSGPKRPLRPRPRGPHPHPAGSPLARRGRAPAQQRRRERTSAAAGPKASTPRNP